MMKNRQDKFSLAEWFGIILMIAGLAIGFYGSIVGFQVMSESIRGFSTFLEGAADLSEIKTAVGNVTDGLARGQAIIGRAGTGFWMFLTGIAVFTVFRRQRWNASLSAPINSNQD